MSDPNVQVPDDYALLTDSMQESPGPRAAQGSYQTLGPARRQKQWEAMTADERIERLREVVRSKDMSISELQAQLNALQQHQHGAQGQIMVPVYHAFGGIGRCYDPLA